MQLEQGIMLLKAIFTAKSADNTDKNKGHIRLKMDFLNNDNIEGESVYNPFQSSLMLITQRLSQNNGVMLGQNILTNHQFKALSFIST